MVKVSGFLKTSPNSLGQILTVWNWLDEVVPTPSILKMFGLKKNLFLKQYKLYPPESGRPVDDYILNDLDNELGIHLPDEDEE